MIWMGKDHFRAEEGEPVFRTCWKCNEAHERLKKVNTLHVCISCGRYWVFDRFLDEFDTDRKVICFMNKNGVKFNGSTKDVDKGYRVSCVTIKLEKHKGEQNDTKTS